MASPRHIHDDSIWTKSNILNPEPHLHDPFVVIFEDDNGPNQVEIVNSLAELLYWDDDVKVLWQWAGERASHFFELTVGDIKANIGKVGL